MSNKIHIANNSGEELLVMVTNNKDFVPTDIGFSFVKAAAITAITGGAGTPAAAATVSRLARTIKTLKDLYSLFGKLQKMYKLADSITQKHMEKNVEHVKKLFRDMSVKIPAGDFKMVNEKFINPFENVKPVIPESFQKALKDTAGDGIGNYLINQVHSYTNGAQVLYNAWNNIDPSVSLGLFDFVGDMTIFIATADFRKICFFNTNSDHSWIVNKTDIVRAKYGKIWEEDRAAGWQIFSNTFGAVLGKDQYFEPHDSLDTQTVNYEGPGDFIPEIPRTNIVGEVEDDSFLSYLNPLKNAQRIARFAEKNANTVVQTARDLIHGVTNAPSTMFSFPYKLVYQPDGNLVLYHIKGDYPQPVWSTGTDKKPAGKVIMQADGNLVVYGPKGEVQWALWGDMPKGYEGSFIGLDKINGRIAYYKNGNTDKVEFYVNDKKDCRRG